MLTDLEITDVTYRALRAVPMSVPIVTRLTAGQWLLITEQRDL